MNPITATIKITAETKNQRLDRFLADFDVSRSRAAWQKAIKREEVQVNDKVFSADYILKEGDELSILAEKAPTEKPRIPAVDIPIVYEDDEVIVLDKPVGVISERAASSDAPAVTDFLEKHYPPIKQVGEAEQRSGLVHRLDKDTSGLLLAAKTQTAFEFLKTKFKARDVRKVYTALVYGQIQPLSGEINLAIGRNPKDPCRQIVVRNPENSNIKSRPARTLYRTLRTFPGFSLLQVELKTGRMHQIRVHLKALGHPVAGDHKYASRQLLQKTPGLERQFLHASELEIALPNGQIHTFHSALPADLQGFLQILNDLD